MLIDFFISKNKLYWKYKQHQQQKNRLFENVVYKLCI